MKAVNSHGDLQCHHDFAIPQQQSSLFSLYTCRGRCNTSSLYLVGVLKDLECVSNQVCVSFKLKAGDGKGPRRPDSAHRAHVELSKACGDPAQQVWPSGYVHHY